MALSEPFCSNHAHDRELKLPGLLHCCLSLFLFSFFFLRSRACSGQALGQPASAYKGKEGKGKKEGKTERDGRKTKRYGRKVKANNDEATMNVCGLGRARREDDEERGEEGRGAAKNG